MRGQLLCRLFGGEPGGSQIGFLRGALRGWTQEKIAKEWPESISQQAVTKHLDGAQWPALEAALLYVENNLQRL